MTFKNLLKFITKCVEPIITNLFRAIQWLSTTLSNSLVKCFLQPIWSAINPYVNPNSENFFLSLFKNALVFLLKSVVPSDPELNVLNSLTYKGKEIDIMVVPKYSTRVFHEYYSDILHNALQLNKKKSSSDSAPIELIFGIENSFCRDYFQGQKNKVYFQGQKNKVINVSDRNDGAYTIHKSDVKSYWLTKAQSDPSDISIAKACFSVFSDQQYKSLYSFKKTILDSDESDISEFFVPLIYHNDEKRFQTTNYYIEYAFMIWWALGIDLDILRSGMQAGQWFIMKKMSFPLVLFFNYSLKFVEKIYTLVNVIPNIMNPIKYTPQSVQEMSAYIVKKVQSLSSPFPFLVGTRFNSAVRWVNLIEIALRQCASTVGSFLPFSYQKFEVRLGLLALYAPLPAALVVIILQISSLFFFTNISLAALSLAPASVVLFAEYAAVTFAAALTLNTCCLWLKFFANKWIFNIENNDSVLKAAITQSMDEKTRLSDSSVEPDKNTIKYSNAKFTVPFRKNAHFTDPAKNALAMRSIDQLLGLSNQPSDSVGGYNTSPSDQLLSGDAYFDNYALSLHQTAAITIDSACCYILRAGTGNFNAYKHYAQEKTKQKQECPNVCGWDEKFTSIWNGIRGVGEGFFNIGNILACVKGVFDWKNYWNGLASCVLFFTGALKYSGSKVLVRIHRVYQDSLFHGNCQQWLLEKKLHKIQSDYLHEPTKQAEHQASNASESVASPQKLVLFLPPEKALSVIRALEQANTQWEHDKAITKKNILAG